MLLPTLTRWQAQYERMTRAYARLGEPYESSIAYDDDLQHFFQDCWHLKDWIRNDPTLGIGDAIEGEVDAHLPLRIAADLANGSKHYVRRVHREGAHVTSINVTVHLGQAKGIDVRHVITLSNGSSTSAQTVAKEAVDAWHAILRKLGLI